MNSSLGFGRRAFLRGAGAVTLALPWLDAFAPRAAKARAAAVPKFVVIVHQANGVAQPSPTEPIDYFWPREVGPITSAVLRAEHDRTVAVLADHADRLLVVRGLKYGFANYVCSHVSGFTQLLTACEPLVEPITSQISATSESIDHRIARAINPDGREALNLLAPAKDVMAFTPSHRAAGQPRAVDSSPWTVYKRMVGLSSADEVTASMVAMRRKSVNDLVRDQLKELLSRRDLSREDRRRLDLHLSSVRDVEVKLACNLGDLSQPELDEAAINDWRNLGVVTELHMDLIALSCACDYSRVATLSIGGCGNNARFVLPNHQGSELHLYHGISHRAVVNEGKEVPIERALELHREIDKWHASRFKYLLDKLAAHTVNDRTLLDCGMVIWTNEVANGAHSFENLPWVIAGGANGYLKQGVYVDAGNVTHNLLLNTLLDALDVRGSGGERIDNFGDPRLTRGRLDQIVTGA